MSKRVGIITLGCDKNTVDNEYLAGLLSQEGCELVSMDFDGAVPSGLDAVVVTTCGFIESAREQSVDTILEMADRKTRLGDPRCLFVAGCLSQRYGEQLMAEIPEIDGLVGVGQFARMAEMITALDAGERQSDVRPEPCMRLEGRLSRRRLDARPYAFLKISDGCNHACTFCSIPLIKGHYHSVAREILLDEARELIASGVREINLVAQDISIYGSDLGGDYRLPDLLRDLCALEGDFWIRCLYCYPGLIDEALIEALATQPKIVPYLDMPLQHLAPDVLKRMKRPHHETRIDALVGRLREAIPGLTLRTTMIVGDPGETPADHRALLAGLERLRFERLGAFEYSPEEGTPAATAPRQVGLRTRSKRWNEVMAAQMEIAEGWNQGRVGTVVRVLIDEYDEAAGLWVGRSAAEAPEVDGKIFVQSSQPLAAGQFVAVRIEEASAYDLSGTAVEG